MDEYRSESNLSCLTDGIKGDQKKLLENGLPIFKTRTWDEARKLFRSRYSADFSEEYFFEKEANGQLTLGQYEAPHHKHTAQSVTFDKNGRQVADFDQVGNTRSQYVYDRKGRLIAKKQENTFHGTNWQFKYNWQGELVKVTTQLFTRGNRYQEEAWGQKQEMNKQSAVSGN